MKGVLLGGLLIFNLPARKFCLPVFFCALKSTDTCAQTWYNCIFSLFHWKHYCYYTVRSDV
jgi:hypothetical protein